MNGTAIGVLICSVFGGVWAVAGSTGLARRARAFAIAIAAVVTALLVAFVFLHPPALASGQFDQSVYSYSVIGEVAAIVLAVVILRLNRRADLILPAVGLIVGLHFIGMWKAIGLVLFLAVAVAMSVVSLLAFALPGRNARGVSLRQAVAGFGCALVLWIAALALW